MSPADLLDFFNKAKGRGIRGNLFECVPRLQFLLILNGPDPRREGYVQGFCYALNLPRNLDEAFQRTDRAERIETA